MTCPSWCVHHTDPRHTWHRGGAHDDRVLAVHQVQVRGTDVLSAATRGGAR